MVAGVIVVEGKVISGRSCSPSRDNCYVAAHDAKTGAELWRFYTAAGSNEPGGDTWAGAPDATRSASTWGLPGGYDPVKRLVYWGVANPTPEHARQPARRTVRRGRFHGADRPLQQLHHRAEPGHRQAGLVLPAPAGRRLGRGLSARADPAADRGQPRSEVREMDQSRREERGAARCRADGRRGRRHLRARPRHRAVPVGQPVPVRHAQLPHLERGRQDRPRDDQQGRHVHRPAGSQGDLLLEHAQLLADGLSSRDQLAVRALRRELSRHDDGRTEPHAAGAPRRDSRARAATRTSGPG